MPVHCQKEQMLLTVNVIPFLETKDKIRGQTALISKARGTKLETIVEEILRRRTELFTPSRFPGIFVNLDIFQLNSRISIIHIFMPTSSPL